MRIHLKKLTALLLAVILCSGLLPTALASDRTSLTDEAETAELPLSGFHHVELPGYRLPAKARLRENLPASYNSAALGYDTAVKNQAPYGTCWAFGTLSPIETYMIKHGIPVGTTGAAATADLDLSEYHLSYFSYTDACDALGLTAGDSSVLSQSHLNIGGDGYKSTLTLMRWEGPASEEIPALAYSEAGVGAAIDPAYAYDCDVAHLADADWIPTSDQQSVKRALMEYGAGFFGYYFSSAYNTTNGSGAYCCIQQVDASGDYAHGANHAVTLVGWDDNYPKENFNAISRPSKDGAWIVKNSWGTTGSNAAYTQNGYNYISYEDTASLNEICMFFRVEPVDKYQHLYQYDGTLNIDDYVGLTANHSQIANVFTAAGHEQLRAVSILTLEEGLSYTLEIYKGLSSDTDPTSGTLVCTQEGTIDYHGYHTVELTQPVPVDTGERFSCVFTLHSAQPTDTLMMVLPIDATRTDNYEGATLVHTHAVHENTSFFRIAGTGSAWSQPKNGAGNFRIKAYTVDDPYALTAVSEDPAKGSVSVGAYTEQGWVVTAAPAEGYYASGWELLSGSVQAVQDGNTFYFEPREDSTVRILFSEKTAVTLTYLANGVSVGTVSAVTGEPVTLPETAPAYEGYAFLGWTPRATADAATQPQTFAPGGTYYPTGNDTLHALYRFSRLGVEGEDGSYVKVTESAALTDGRYLIVNEDRQFALNGALIDHAIDVLDNEMPVSVQDGRIPESAAVNDGAFTYHAERHSLAGKREVSSGNVYYIASPSWNNWIQYIYTTPYEPPAERLSFTFAEDGSVGIHDNYYNSDLKYYDNGSEANFRFTKSGTDISPIALYRKTEDTTQILYTTVPDGINHVPGTPVTENEVPAGCSAEGSYDLAVYCVDCGAELSRTHITVPALGHDWDAPDYVWAEDCSTVTATRICKNDETHIETETVDTSSEVTQEATYDAEGEITYTATFENPAFAAQTKTVSTPKLEQPTEATEEPTGNPFRFDDVQDENQYYFDPVYWAYYHDPQITNGTSSTTFSPMNTCTRAQVVTFLWRAMGCPEPEALKDCHSERSEESQRYGLDSSSLAPQNDRAESAANPFTDVASNQYYYKAVLWAVEKGITNGTGKTEFSPGKTCTRGQIVTFLYRAYAG